MGEETLPPLTEEELNLELEKIPNQQVTDDYIQGRLYGRPQFIRATDTLTICVLKVDNGFAVTGEWDFLNSDNYNQKLAEDIAYKNAFTKLYELFAFVHVENGTLKK